MDDKLDEWQLGEPSPLASRRNHVNEAKNGELYGNLERFHQLSQHGSSPEAGQALVPDGAEQLLHIRMSDKLS